MAEMKARHAFGKSSSIEAAKQANKINEFDILFLDGDTDPKIGWLDAQGNTEIVSNKADLSGVEAELATKASVESVAALETEVATKASAEEVKSLGSQIASKADASEVAELGAEIANKVDVATVKTMISEAEVGVIEVVEF